MQSAYLESLIVADSYVTLDMIAPHFSVELKLEGLSVSGSIKVKPAIFMIEGLELEGRLKPGSRIVESSSGNLGLALSMICAAKGYAFTCVSDPAISPLTAKLIEAYGAELIIVQERDANGGFLETRIDYIQAMRERDPDLIWVNQYENILNIEAHYKLTGPEILRTHPRPDIVFIGAGTTGTLGGVSRYLRERSPSTIIVAVDSVGSVTFGGAGGKRHIPGLGTSKPPDISRHASFDELLLVPEADTVKMCRRMARTGLLLGGSTGTVLCGIERFAGLIEPDACVVAVSPDMGERYIDTVYNDNWVEERFPGLLEPARATSPPSHINRLELL